MSKSRFVPIYDRLLVRQLDPETKIGSIIIPDQGQEKPNIGIVMEVGPGTPEKDGSTRPIAVKKGDTILFQRYAGLEIDLNVGEKAGGIAIKSKFMVIQEDEILGKLMEVR